jgi:uncharacterized protein
MKIDEVIRDFAVTGSTLPRDSMRWALDNWEAAAPRFIELLDRYAGGVDRSDETANALFFIVHLLAERRETKAFAALCRLLTDAGATEQVLDEAITETLRGVLIATYDGDPAALKEVIEATTANEFARAAALEAMVYLTRTGAFTDDDMRNYLLHLRAEMQPRADCFVWSAWAMSAANLGYEDYAGTVEELIRDDFMLEFDMTLEDFASQLRLTLGDDRRMAGFEHDRIAPFSDAIGTLSGWYGFSEQFKLDQASGKAEAEDEFEWPGPQEPYVNPLRHVGRNDLCPCGSGKKYKKCCLQ